MSTTLDEQDRQKKQAEMIRQYLQITNIDSNPSAASKEPPATLSVRVTSPAEPSANKVKTIDIGPLSFDPNEFRKEIEQAEQRVERLRHEVKELQKKRQEQSLRSPPPSSLHFAFPSSIEFDFPLRQFQRPVMSNALPPFTNAHLSFLGRFLPPTTGRPSLDDRHRQFLWTMQQHREQLLLYLDSLKQALASLDRLASVEPSRNEIHLAHMKLDTIQQKSRQLQALKSTRSAQHSPFIKCRIRHLERDLVQMLSEHQKDVQTKLELNEQRSLMLTKIMQVNDELTALDQQIHQILPNTPVDPHRVNPSSSTTATAPVPEYNVHPLNKLPHTFGN